MTTSRRERPDATLKGFPIKVKAWFIASASRVPTCSPDAKGRRTRRRRPRIGSADRDQNVQRLPRSPRAISDAIRPWHGLLVRRCGKNDRRSSRSRLGTRPNVRVSGPAHLARAHSSRRHSSAAMGCRQRSRCLPAARPQGVRRVDRSR